MIAMPGFAQISIPTASPSQISDFENSITYIVKEDILISDYNLGIEDIVNQYWNITETETISATEFKEMRKNPEASFIYMNPVYFDKDKTQTAYEYLFLSLGHPSGDPSQMPDLCAVPLAVKGTDQTEFVYKLGLVLQFMQNHVKVTKKHPSYDDESIVDYYTDQTCNLKQKELWLLKPEVENTLHSPSGMQSVYPYPFRYVSRQDIKKAISDNREDVIILHLITAGENRYCFKLLVNAGNADLYFYDYHKIKSRKPSVLLEKDLKKFVK
jgi:hypothetical protein